MGESRKLFCMDSLEEILGRRNTGIVGQEEQKFHGIDVQVGIECKKLKLLASGIHEDHGSEVCDPLFSSVHQTPIEILLTNPFLLLILFEGI